MEKGTGHGVKIGLDFTNQYQQTATAPVSTPKID
jgi:hypothetical protein